MNKSILMLITVVYCGCSVGSQTEFANPESSGGPTKEWEQSVKAFFSTPEVEENVRRIETGLVTERQIRILALILQNTREINVHRMRGFSTNHTYLSRDGHKEAVFDQNGLPVADAFNGPSYNYYSIRAWPLSHFMFDTFPWLILGNSPKDPTSHSERTHAFCLDFEAALLESIANPDRDSISVNEQLRSSGAKEVVALLLYCLEEKDATEFYSLFDSGNELDQQKVHSLVVKLESKVESYVYKASKKAAKPK